MLPAPRPQDEDGDQGHPFRRICLSDIIQIDQSTRSMDAKILAPSQSQFPATPLPTFNLPPPPSGPQRIGQIKSVGMKRSLNSMLWHDENTLCILVEAKGVCVARREDNDMINGSKLLNVAGMTRDRRNSLLKHEKTRLVIEVAPMVLKGTWIPYDRALELANEAKITDQLYPLFVHDIGTLLYRPCNNASENSQSHSLRSGNNKQNIPYYPNFGAAKKPSPTPPSPSINAAKRPLASEEIGGARIWSDRDSRRLLEIPQYSTPTLAKAPAYESSMTPEPEVTLHKESSVPFQEFDKSIITRWQESTSMDASDRNDGLVNKFSQACLQSLSWLVANLGSVTATKRDKNSLRRSQVTLKLWMNGHKVVEGQLDAVLEKSKDLQHMTLSIMHPLCKVLTKAIKQYSLPGIEDLVCEQLRIENTQLCDKTRWLLLRPGHCTDDSDSGSDSDTSDEDDDGATQDDRFGKLAENVKTLVECLTDLSVGFENPAVDPEDNDEPSFLRVEQRSAHDFHADLIRAKYPEACSELIECLGKISWNRYIRMQHSREQNSHDGPTCVVSTMKSHVTGSKFQDSGLGTSLPPTRYAESVISYMTSITGGKRVTIPPLTSEAKAGKPFECNACGRYLRATNNRDWRKHLYLDLQPYTCIYAACAFSAVPFSDRKFWSDHLELEHGYGPDWVSVECPLCRQSTEAGKSKILIHFARHMEDIALCALPRDVESEDEESDDSQSTSTEDNATIEFAEEPKIGDKGKNHVHTIAPDINTNLAQSQDMINEDNEAESSTIKCICGFTSDDGKTILCEVCDTWQHIACFYHSSDAVPDVHECAGCHPRPLNRERTGRTQFERRTGLSVSNDRSKAEPQKTSDQKKTYDSSLLNEQKSPDWSVPFSHTGRIIKTKDGEVHACECGRAYTRAEHLKRHQDNYAQDAPLTCNHPGCGKVFYQRDLLQRHQERHNETDEGDRVTYTHTYPQSQDIYSHPLMLFHGSQMDMTKQLDENIGTEIENRYEYGSAARSVVKDMQSQISLGKKSLESSSQMYDKQLLSRLTGTPALPLSRPTYQSSIARTENEIESMDFFSNIVPFKITNPLQPPPEQFNQDMPMGLEKRRIRCSGYSPTIAGDVNIGLLEPDPYKNSKVVNEPEKQSY